MIINTKALKMVTIPLTKDVFLLHRNNEDLFTFTLGYKLGVNCTEMLQDLLRYLTNF